MSGKKSVIEPKMVQIPAGDFLMGCDAGAENERPLHRVWVGSFAIARTATTNRLYRDFLDQTRRRMPPGWDDEQFNHPDQPVTGVSWFDAVEYCSWLGACTDRPYRLPTEAEWERAARGGMEGKLYTWGDEPPERQPHYSELWRFGPERVGRRPPNGFGICDISENVHEWCADWYDAKYYEVSPSHDPPGPLSGARRSSRGGAWRHQVKIARVAARSSLPPQFQYSDFGFRCASSAA